MQDLFRSNGEKGNSYKKNQINKLKVQLNYKENEENDNKTNYKNNKHSF